MGDQKKEEAEKKVPVFTVFKKNSILKNIFLDAPQTNEPLNSTTNQEDDEQVIVIGRHPDCSITLDHPSISRFHLRLHSKPSSLSLSLVDLSSVHGTWVSGKKVEPGVQVDLNEGDIVQLGGSSRRYMLHWVPMSRAYNSDVPFVPPMDVLMTVKEGEELSNQDENCCSSIETNQIQSQCKTVGDLDLSISKKEMTVSPLAPTMPEFGDSSRDNEKAKKGNLSREKKRKQNEISGISSEQPLKEELIEEIKNQHSDKDSENSPNATNPSKDPDDKDLFREEHEENEISGFSSETLLKEGELIEEIKNQHSDKGWENSPNASSPSNDHNKDLFREEHEENEISGFSSGTPLKESAVTKFKNQQSDKENDENPQALAGLLTGISYAKSPSGDHNKNLLREEYEENENSAFSSGQLLSESIVEIEYRQYDEEYENSQDLNEVISGIADANSTTSIDHYEHPLRGEFEENEIHAFSSGQLLNESVEEIKHLQYDGEYEKSQPLNGVLSGIENVNSSPTMDHREEFAEHAISAFSSGQLLNESVLEVECQQYDEALDGVLSGIANANSSSTIYHNEHPLKEEFKKDKISAFTSLQILSESVVEIGNQQYDEDEKDEISAFTSVQILNESVVEIGNQQYDENNVKSQAVDGVPSSVANSHSLCQNYHNNNLSEFFNSSFSNEDVEVICASRMDNEQEKMSTSSCYSPCSSTILERKDQLYLYKQDHNVQDSSSSEVHAIQPLRNTPSKSEQESHWPEIMGHSFSNVGKSSEALDNESSLKEDNKQKEITVITRAPKMDLMNLSICCESIPAEDCFGQLDEKNKTGQTFAINVSDPKDTDVNTPLRSGKQSDPPTIRGKPTSIDIQTGKWFPTDTEAKELYEENVDYGSVSKALMSNGEVFAEEIFTPDKENFNPTTPKLKSTKKTDKLEEIKFSDPLCLSSLTKNSICSNFVQSDELLFSSDKENHTPKVHQKSRLVQPASKNSARLNLQPATKNGISRIPFKSLLSNSSSKSCSSNSGKYVKPIEKNAVAGDKRWIMVADTNSLLNKVSRKALQLLQGVKGTQLIIPRVVIRELDCMKRKGYLFTRTTEILSALQWIEDCMINTNWWIHVESLMEEGRHLTPSPSLSTSEGEIEDFAFSSTPFSAFPKFLEIVSLMPGDHILECALLNRRMKNDENLVILSDDVSLKIKAMAEGIICEAAEEFRESLVNPFSDRFLWAKSTPRGLTWSCADDTVLREKYYRGPFKKPPSKSGESLKGLKLILVQNSHLGGLIPNSLEMNCF